MAVLSISDPPDASEGEISVFGRGYGECIVVHLGDGEWMVIDSCLGHAKAVALEYFEQIGVPLSGVKLVVLSHWDDDHIRGIGEVFRHAVNSQWVASAALNTDEFKRLMLAGRQAESDSATNELEQLFAVLKQRRDPKQRVASLGPRWALEGQTLIQNKAATVRVIAPSPATHSLGQREVSQLVEQVSAKRRLVAQRPNLLSVALHLRLGSFAAVLGGDLESTTNPATGWSGVLAMLALPAEIAGYLKVPHHGSLGAHHAGVWSQLLQPRPLAVTTTFNPTGLPLKRDRKRLLSLSGSSYLTGTPGGPKSQHRIGDRTIREVVPVLRKVVGALGHVRVRVALQDGAVPRVDVFGAAFLDSFKAVG